ncbi:MAG: UDP-N-acetylmuramoyl-L-alanyl-D-glutamate--2,6-diaminopimelate ligase [Candidatus Magasanikiibacteriota bacterium]
MTLAKLVPQKLKNYYHALDSHIGNIQYGLPVSKLKIIGITGTDGKTTTSNILYEILSVAQKKVGLISSINARLGDEELPLKFHVTTPDPRDIMYILNKMVQKQMEFAVLETTSHALEQSRVGAISYVASGFTNITREHLDYHKTFEAYRDAKAKLISQTRKGGTVVLNADDPSFEYLQNKAKGLNLKTFSYGIENDADFMAKNVTISSDRQSYALTYPEGKQTQIELFLPGEYNISNSLSAAALAFSLGINIDAIKDGIANTKLLNGRWEIIREEPYQIVVDFAHTPNAIQNVLEFARKKVSGNGKVHVVFGCAGRRDFTKRPVMGEIAGKNADFVYITAEDPRDEDIHDINASIASGVEKAGKIANINYFNIPDRTEAIKKALSSAKKGDIVLITGKGHERSMNLDGKSEIPWSDQEVVNKLLQ